MADSLLERCRKFAESIDGCPEIDLFDLADFVRSEIGRAADMSLEETAPLVLYFGTEEDRAEFLAVIKEAKPGMIERKWP